MRESLGDKPKGVMKVKVASTRPVWDPCGFCGRTAHHSPVPVACSKAKVERIRWDPKDGELCLSRMKPEEILVEVRSGSDVQIDRLTWLQWRKTNRTI
ncbi:unnamed protein product [Toxocara canis]|uniref:Fumarylacetoacetate hydrolase n=1 Tax=Toxocara canis TaxID=6265 RepID=A0A183U6G7_TOXCA|nr:unnamed protein product [Toxocara canis]